MGSQAGGYNRKSPARGGASLQGFNRGYEPAGFSPWGSVVPSLVLVGQTPQPWITRLTATILNMGSQAGGYK